VKYIGIRGHRGAGKSTIAFLLANAINYLLYELPEEGFDEAFARWCRDIKENPELVNYLDFSRIIVEEFGDGPKIMVSMLTGIEFSNITDHTKDNTVINLRTFEKLDKSEIDTNKLYSAEEVAGWSEKANPGDTPPEHAPDVWMTLRQFILYFGVYIMQNFFGRDVWVKTLIANTTYWNGLFPEDKNLYKIIADVKTPAEIDFIKSKDGTIISVERPNHLKMPGMDFLKNDKRCDYQLIISEDVTELSSSILNIAKNIINH
jgi:hypothetical protein